MEDIPAKAFRNKRNSSMHKSVELLTAGKGNVFFTTGNTGAAVTVSYFISGLYKFVRRPALAINYPSFSGKKITILDVGATIDPTAEDLFLFAKMGAALNKVANNNNPAISILNVGEEFSKGKEFLIEAAKMIDNELNYNGFIEGNELFLNPKSEVIVTDGFTGNVALKTIEGLSEAIAKHLTLKKEKHYKLVKLYSVIFKNKFLNIASKYNYTKYGTAFLLGLNHLVCIGHGRSNVVAFESALKSIVNFIENNNFESIKQQYFSNN
jgi:glycerol-3-phosphate acyltransferase PlsX